MKYKSEAYIHNVGVWVSMVFMSNSLKQY